MAAGTGREDRLLTRNPYIGVLAERRYMTQAQPAGLCSRLRARGHPVTVIDPEAASFEIQNADWLDGLGLVVARGRSSALLGMLAWAEARGIAIINRRSAIAAVHNKAEMAAALATADVPTPRTFLGPARELAHRVPSAIYPLVLKPILGDNCRGLRFIRTPGELSALELQDPVVLAQEFLPNDGYDLKLYGIGDQIWPVRKASPFNPLVPTRGSMDSRTTAQLLPLIPAIEELGRRCRELFCLELYGVDCIETSRGPVVIEVNEFPNYTGVPDADERLADYLLRRAPQRCTDPPYKGEPTHDDHLSDHGATSTYPEKPAHARCRPLTH